MLHNSIMGVSAKMALFLVLEMETTLNFFSVYFSDPSSTSAQPRLKSQSAAAAASGGGKSKTAAGGATSSAGGVATVGEARKVPKWFKMGK